METAVVCCESSESSSNDWQKIRESLENQKSLLNGQSYEEFIMLSSSSLIMSRYSRKAVYFLRNFFKKIDPKN